VAALSVSCWVVNIENIGPTAYREQSYGNSVSHVCPIMSKFNHFVKLFKVIRSHIHPYLQTAAYNLENGKSYSG